MLPLRKNRLRSVKAIWFAGLIAASSGLVRKVIEAIVTWRPGEPQSEWILEVTALCSESQAVV
jgi:hypothetical protein